MAAKAFVYAQCAPCGALVADRDAHALWHARIADIVPLLADTITTLDPVTGTPVPALRPAAELADAATAATLKGQAAAALAGDTKYLALTTPTTAQTVAQVQALTRQTSTLLRLVVRALS